MAGQHAPTVHATAVLVGARAALIRGPAGSGKSRLALMLIESLPFARLVADDRVHLDAVHGRLIARPPQTLAGLIELHGLGLRRLPYEPMALVGLVVDLMDEDAARLPAPGHRLVEIAGISLPRLAVAPGMDPFPMVLAKLKTREADL